MAEPIKSALTIDTSKFTKSLSVAGKAVGGLASGVGFLIGVITKLTVVLTGATTVLAFFLRTQIALIDRLGKVSKVTGFTTNQLQGLRFAAELAGVSSDQLDVALRRFSRRLGEAGRGTGELLPALRRLGIAVRDDEGQLRNVNDVLLDFADGVDKTSGETAKLSLAFKAFDSEGAELVNMLNGGSKSLTRMSGILEDYGIIISDKAVKSTEDLNDSLTAFGMMITTISREVIGQLAPALQELSIKIIDELVQQVNSAEGGLEGLAITIGQTLVKAVRDATVGVITFYNTAIVPLINGFIDLASAFNAPGTELMNLRKNLAEFKDLAGQGLISRLTTLSVTSGKTAEILEKKLGKGFLLTKENIAIAIQAIEEEIKRLESTGQTGFEKLLGIDQASIERIKKTFDDIIEGVGGEPFTIDPKPIENVITKAKQLDTILSFIFGKERTAQFWDDWYDSGVGSLTKLGAIAKLILGEQIFDNLRESLEAAGVGDFIKTMTDGLTKAAVMFEDALTDAVLTGKAEFSDLADHLRQVLAKALVQKFITGPIMGLFGLAKGGPAKAGQPYIVGEEGPELFVPKQSGTVIPNDMVNSMSGGPAMGMGSGVVNYNINAVDAPSFQQLVARDPEFIYNVSRAGARRTPA